eukprot:Awhi_evm1s7578
MPTCCKNVERVEENTDTTPLLGDQNRSYSITGEEVEEGPKDTYFVAYYLLFFLGIATLFPWNMFINAESYFRYRLKGTPYESNFENYIATVTQVANVITLFLNVRFGYKVEIKYRISIPVIIQLLIFITNTLLVHFEGIDPEVFFEVTLALCAVSGCCAAILQGGLFGLASTLSGQYVQVMMVGQALGGIVVSIASIISLSADNDVRSSAFIYFVVSVGVIFLSLLSFFALIRIPFVEFRFNRNCKDKSASKPKFEIGRTVRSIWPLMINIFCVFFVSLTLFPAVTAKIQPVDADELLQRFFTPVFCFLGFNLFDFLGRSFAGYIQFPSSKYLFVPVFLRLVFFALFLLCNAPGTISDVVVFSSMWWPIVFMAIFAFTNGYFGSLCFMYAPALVQNEDQECAGAII